MKYLTEPEYYAYLGRFRLFEPLNLFELTLMEGIF
jgi:hypothetical protein